MAGGCFCFCGRSGPLVGVPSGLWYSLGPVSEGAQESLRSVAEQMLGAAHLLDKIAIGWGGDLDDEAKKQAGELRACAAELRATARGLEGGVDG